MAPRGHLDWAAAPDIIVLFRHYSLLLANFYFNVKSRSFVPLGCSPIQFNLENKLFNIEFKITCGLGKEPSWGRGERRAKTNKAWSAAACTVCRPTSAHAWGGLSPHWAAGLQSWGQGGERESIGNTARWGSTGGRGEGTAWRCTVRWTGAGSRANRSFPQIWRAQGYPKGGFLYCFSREWGHPQAAA